MQSSANRCKGGPLTTGSRDHGEQGYAATGMEAGSIVRGPLRFDQVHKSSDTEVNKENEGSPELASLLGVLAFSSVPKLLYIHLGYRNNILPESTLNAT